MGLSSAGIGSNLDVDGIVSKLMSVEQQPLALLQKKETSYQAKLSGFGTLKGAMSSFQTAVRSLSDLSKFQVSKTSIGDPLVATATSNATAAPGSYALKVTQLAQSQKLVAAGTASQIAPIGSGVISIDFGTITGGTLGTDGKYTGGADFTSGGGGIKTVTIDATNNSLAGIRDAINKAGVGVTASIVNDGGSSPYRLALTSEATGKTGSMRISVAETGGPGLGALLNNDPEGDQALAQTAAGQNAEMTIDGIEISKPSNSVTDVITGVTLNLLKTNPTQSTPIIVARDSAAVTTSINAFVKAYNDISQTLRDAAAYNPATRQAAVLNGEASVRTIGAQVRGVMTASIAGGGSVFSRLSEIGVTLQKDGLLQVDSTKLNKAMTSNFDDIGSLFAAAGKSTDSLVSYVSANNKTKPGSYDVNISQLATKGATQATAPAGLDITADNNSLTVMLNGLSATIKLDIATYDTHADLAAAIQSKINGVPAFSGAGSAVSVTHSDLGVLNITSNKFGSASGVNITETGIGPNNLKFDTSGANVTPGLDVAGTINGLGASGNGQLLTSLAGGPSEGLGITVSGGVPGPHGKINYSQGYAYQFDKMITSMLDTGGVLASRTEGLTASIKALTKSQQDMTSRLAGLEKRYRAQFTALDLTVSKMSTTSNFLSQQLAQISSLTA